MNPVEGEGLLSVVGWPNANPVGVAFSAGFVVVNGNPPLEPSDVFVFVPKENPPLEPWFEIWFCCPNVKPLPEFPPNEDDGDPKPMPALVPKEMTGLDVLGICN